MIDPRLLRIDADRLHARIDALAQIGPIDGGGSCRLALTDDDRRGRDQVAEWMRACGLVVSVDAIGNLFGYRAGTTDLPPVMPGSHIDTVRTGGRYDGSYGVLAGLEVAQTFNDAGLGDELRRIGYAGVAPIGMHRPGAFVELHIEKGPVLDLEGLVIGAVEDLQGISWRPRRGPLWGTSNCIRTWST